MRTKLSYALSGDETLPDGWEWSTVGEVADITAGNPAPQGGEFFEGGTKPFVRVQDMGRLGGAAKLYDTHDHINDKAAKKLRLFPQGSVLFTKSGASTLLNQRAILARDMYVVSHIATAIPKKDISSEWLYYWMRTVDFAYLAHATTLPSLPLPKAKAILIPVPPPLQQQRIVAEIEKQFSHLDEAVANLKRVKANLKRYKAAVLKAAVEGKLTEDWRKQHPNVEPASKLLDRILADKQAKERIRGYEPLDVSLLEQLPRGWCWARIEDLGHVQLGRQRAPKYHSGKNMRPYLRVQNVFEDRIDLEDVKEMDFHQEDFRKFKLEPGDILLNEGQSPELLGRPAIYRGELPGACFTNTLIRFKAYAPVTPEYPLIVFRAYMRTGRFTLEGTITTNIAHLSAGRFAKIEFPVPPIREQQEIVAEVERRLSVIEELQAAVEADLTRADRLRQSILSQAFSGRLLTQGSKDIPGTVATFSIAAESQASYGKDNRAGR